MKLSEARTYLNGLRNAIDKGDAPGDPKLIKEALDAVLGTYAEPTFIITTRDRFGPGTVRTWLWNLRSIAGEEAKQKIAEASDVLNRMQEFHETQPDNVRNPE